MLHVDILCYEHYFSLSLQSITIISKLKCIKLFIYNLIHFKTIVHFLRPVSGRNRLIFKDYAPLYEFLYHGCIENILKSHTQIVRPRTTTQIFVSCEKQTRD